MKAAGQTMQTEPWVAHATERRRYHPENRWLHRACRGRAVLSQDRHQNGCHTPRSLGPSHWQNHSMGRPAEPLIQPGPGTLTWGAQ